MQTHLVLVHGSMASSAQWRDYPGLLPEFEVTAIDLPGHGRRAHEAFSTGAALDAIGDAVGEGSRTILAGHSLGGYLAGLYAGTRPNSLAGLVIMGATGNPRSPLAGSYRTFSRLTTVVDHGRLARARLRLAARLGVDDGLLPEQVDYATLPAVWQAVFDDCPPRVLRGVGCPVLFVNGQFDQMRVHERRYRSLLPGSEVATIARASHFAPLTHPREVAGALRLWAQRSSTVSAR